MPGDSINWKGKHERQGKYDTIDDLISEFLASETMEQQIPIVLSHPVCRNVL